MGAKISGSFPVLFVTSTLSWDSPKLPSRSSDDTQHTV